MCQNKRVRIAHLADLHLGFSHLNYKAPDGRNQRMVDFERAASLATDELIKREVDLVVIAGDLFHETNMYPGALVGAASLCDRLRAAQIPVIAIGGNHDEAEGEGRYNGLLYLSEKHGLDLHLEQSHVDLGGLRLHLVSYRVISRAQAGRGELKPFEFAGRGDVLVAHGYAPGDGVPDIPEGVETLIPAEWLNDPRFELVMLGHVHSHAEIAPHVFYAGSIERRNFGEAEQRPGFWVHELTDAKLVGSQSVWIDQLSEDDHNPIPRPMIDLEIDCAELTVDQLNRQVISVIENDPRVQRGAMMRVVMENVSAQLDRVRVRDEWARALKKRGGLSFESSARSRQISELLDIKFAAAPTDVGEGFVSYVSERTDGLDATEKKAIRQIAASIVTEARESVLSQEED